MDSAAQRFLKPVWEKTLGENLFAYEKKMIKVASG
jgi:hypothetical protein